MSKPTVVCVPGAWHTPEIYDGVTSILQSHGYPTVGLPLPSVGADPPHKDFTGDVEGIRACLKQLVEDEEKDIVLVMHSYTGMPGAEAPKGLSKAERSVNGLKGGVSRLVFINAFAMPEGFQPTANGAQFPEWMRVDEEKAVVNVHPEDAKAIFYNDISAEEGNKWAAKILPQSVGVYSSTISYAGWRDIPSAFVIGSQDQSSLNRDVALYMINSAREEKPDAFDIVEECDGGHCLMISRPEWLARVLRKAAGEAIE